MMVPLPAPSGPSNATTGPWRRIDRERRWASAVIRCAGLWRTALGGNRAEEAMARLRESFCPEVLTLDPDVMLEDLLDGAAVRGERAGRVDVELSIAEHQEAAPRLERGEELGQQVIDD